jgi:Ca-activated chloride channel family protein
VLVGRYRKSGAAKAVLEGTLGGKNEKFDFPANFVDRSGDESLAFIEKLWAVRRVGEIIDEIDLKGKNSELVHELVELSTRHGILTPYTSFMADETTNIHDLTSNAQSAGRRLDSLAQEGGAGGTAQRAMKGDLQNAYNAAPAQMNEQLANGKSYGLSRFADSAKAKAPSYGGRGPGAGGSGSSSSSATLPSANAFEADKASKDLSYGGEVKSEAQAAGQSLRNIGNRTFYRRGGQWIDTQVNAQQQQNARRVKQFSPEYFELSNRFGRTMSQYLAMDEAVVVNLGGQAYLIEP